MGICGSTKKIEEVKEPQSIKSQDNRVQTKNQQNLSNSQSSCKKESDQNTTPGIWQDTLNRIVTFNSKTFENLLGDTLLNCQKNTELKTKDVLDNCDIVGLYCCDWEKCSDDTSELIKRYKKLKENNKNIEIICLCYVEEQDDFDYCIEDMPWQVLPFKESHRIENLSKKYFLESIPSQRIIDAKTGHTANKNGQSALMSDRYIEEYPYQIKAAYSFEESTQGQDEDLCFVVLQEFASQEIQQKNHASLQKVAQSSNEKASEIKFFSGNKNNLDSTVIIRKQLGLELQLPPYEKYELIKVNNKVGEIWSCNYCSKTSHDCTERFKCYEIEFNLCTECMYQTYTEILNKNPQMFLVNLKQGIFYNPQDSQIEVNESNMQKFLEEFKNGKLTKSIMTSGSEQAVSLEDGLKEHGVCLFLIQELLDLEVQKSNKKLLEDFIKEYKEKNTMGQKIDTFYYANGGRATNSQKKKLKLPTYISKCKHYPLNSSDLGIFGCMHCELGAGDIKEIYECQKCNIYYCEKCYKASLEPTKQELKKAELFIQNFEDGTYAEAHIESNIDMDALKNNVRKYEDGELKSQNM